MSCPACGHEVQVRRAGGLVCTACRAWTKFAFTQKTVKGPRNKFGRKAEKKTAILIGAELQPGSGCIEVPSLKADMRLQNYLIEHKATRADSFRVSKDILRKIEAAAIRIGQQPALVVDFEPDGRRYITLRMEDFMELIRAEND